MKGLGIIKMAVAFFSISYLFYGSNVVVMMSGYAEPQQELTPQQQQQLSQQQGLTPNATASPSPNATASPSPQLQQQAPPITFQQGSDTGGEPCDGAYFVGPGGVTKCM
jgi:hypothetical protein